jgi:hypothetical protein
MTNDFIRSSSRDFIMSGGRDRNFSVLSGFVTELTALRFCFLPWRFPGVTLTTGELALALDNQKRHRRMRINGYTPFGIPSSGPGFQPAFKEITIEWGDDYHSFVNPTPAPVVSVVSQSGGGWPQKYNVGAFTKVLSANSCSYTSGEISITITIEDGIEHADDLEEVYDHLIAVNGSTLGGTQTWISRFEIQGSTPFLRFGPSDGGPSGLFYNTMPPSVVTRSAGIGLGANPIPDNNMIVDFAWSGVTFILRKCHLDVSSAKIWTVIGDGGYSSSPDPEIECGVGAVPDGVLFPPPKDYFDDVRIPIRQNGTWSRYAFPPMLWPGIDFPLSYPLPTCAPEVAG